MQSRLHGWIAFIREILHDAPGEEGPPAFVINRPGQVAMGVVLTVLALMGYSMAWFSSQHLGHRWQICLTLDGQGLLRQNHTETMALIKALDGATPGQQLRLRQQTTWLVQQMDGLCKVSIWYRSQGTALMTVGTGAAALLMVSIALGLPKGLAGSNRILQAIMLTATVQLVLVMSFLQLGEQSLNGSRNLTSYRAHRQLLQWLQSSLANQEVLDPQGQAPMQAQTQGQAPAQTTSPTITELNARVRVAQLIRAMDNRIQALPAITIGLDDGLADQMYGRISSEANPSDGGTSGSGGAPDARLPAAAGTAAEAGAGRSLEPGRALPPARPVPPAAPTTLE